MKTILPKKNVNPYYSVFFILSVGLYIFFSLYGINKAFFLGYDAGVYTQTAFQHVYGQRLYSELFVSQPPLLIEALSVIIQIFGNNVAATRVLPVFFGLIAITASFLISDELFGKRAAYLTGIFLGITFYFIRWTFEIGADLPSLAFSLLTLYFIILYSKTGSLKWVVFSAFFFAITNTFKQLELFFVFPICFLLIFRLEPDRNDLHLTVNGPATRIILAFGIYVGVFSAVLTFILINYDISALVSQVLGLQSEGLFRIKWNRLGRYFGNVFVARQLGLFFLTLASLYYFFRKKRQAFLFFVLLILSQVVFHALMSTWLWGHHLIVLITIFTIVYAGGVDWFLQKIKRLRADMGGLKRAGGKLLFSLFILTIIGVFTQNILLNIRDMRKVKKGPTVEELNLLNLIENHTEREDLIICDNQITLFRSNRFTTPHLVDTSEKRILTGDLDENFLISQAQNVKMVIFWLNRLIRAPQFYRYVKDNYTLIYKKDGKEVYLKKE